MYVYIQIYCIYAREMVTETNISCRPTVGKYSLGAVNLRIGWEYFNTTNWRYHVNYTLQTCVTTQ